MTDDELKALVASLSIAHRETDAHIEALRASQQETDKQLRETDVHIEALRASQQETDQQLRETDVHIKALRTSQQETDRQLQESGRQLRQQLKELGKQIGGLGQKFGGFTEGMAFPSMSKILTERFGMDVVATRVKSRKTQRPLELDVLAYSNSDQNQAYVVEVKSHLRPEGLEQIKTTLQRFPASFPEHRDKALYGILAVVDAPDDLRQQALREGIYLAGIHDEQFILETPEGFTPKDWR